MDERLVPAPFELARTGHYPDAMERCWRVRPARLAAGAAAQYYLPRTTVLNRTMWKDQDWLAGYNGVRCVILQCGSGTGS